MKYTNFENYLQEKHFEKNPMILDDDLPDAFADWLENIDIQDVIDYANEYKKLT